jgi:hypothetical protein
LLTPSSVLTRVGVTSWNSSKYNIVVRQWSKLTDAHHLTRERF